MKKECECAYCGSLFLKRLSEINRSLKNGSLNYCGRKCFGLSRQVNLETTKQRECTECKKTFDVSNFRTRNKNGRTYVKAKCRKCELISNKRGLNLELKKETAKKRQSRPGWLEDNRKKGIEWRAKNIYKNRAYHSKHIKKHVEEISDSYIIRNHFRGQKNIPTEMIEAIRQIIKNKRLINLKNKVK